MSDVNARVLLWGLDGAGKRTTLETIRTKLRDDLTGELREEPTRLDPTVCSTHLPISLGEIGGVGTQIELIAVPGAADQAMTRKQLLDEVDGIVLVLDCSPERIDANFESIDELRTSLAAYGRSLETFPVVLQYNKRDVGDPFAIEDLHRRIALAETAVFETIATTGHGVLHTLTTISKNVVRARRGASGEIDPATADAAAEGAAPPAEPIEAPVALETAATPEAAIEIDEMPEIEVGELLGDDSLDAEPIAAPVAAEEPSTADLLESAILAEGDEAGFQTLGAIEIDPMEASGADFAEPLDETEKTDDGAGGTLRVVSVGQASVDADGGVRLPLVLGDASGSSQSVVLSLRLDALVPRDPSD